MGPGRDGVRPAQGRPRWCLFGASWLMRAGTRSRIREREGICGEVDRQAGGGIWGKLDAPCGSAKKRPR